MDRGAVAWANVTVLENAWFVECLGVGKYV